MTPSNLSHHGDRPATNFLAARNAAFTALLCYARITPAALHCNDFRDCNDRGGEAAASKTEFELDCRPGATTGSTQPIFKTLALASS
jgi:hypothetical protein